MLTLDTAPRISDPDEVYARLIAAHEGLDDEASRKLNAKLILVLANQIGDAEVIGQAIELARSGVEKGSVE